MINRIDKLDQNYFINGDIYYSQVIGNQSSNLTASDVYYFDMFISKYVGLWSSGPTLVRQNVTVPNELKLTRAMNYSSVTATDNSAQIVIEHRIESVFAKELSGEASSLGFHLDNNLFQSVDIEFFIPNVEDDFGAVTQMGSVINKTLSIGAFEKIVLENISMGTLSNGLSVRFTLKDPIDFVTVLNVSLTGFKLSKGTKAQEFSYMGRNTVEELSFCQRYFQKSAPLDDIPNSLLGAVFNDSRAADGRVYASYSFSEIFRVTPVFTKEPISSASAPTPTSIYTKGFGINGIDIGTSEATFIMAWSADARL